MATKIDTKYLKKHVKCWACDSQNLKRRHKQSFKSLIDENGDFNETKIHWRQFECDDCQELTNVSSSDTVLFSQGEDAQLPFTSFRYGVCVFSDFIHLGLFYNSKVKGEVIEDDVRDEHILFFEKFFEKHNIKVANAMENFWELQFSKEHYKFTNFSDGVQIVRDLLKNVGSFYDASIEHSDDDAVFDPDIFF